METLIPAENRNARYAQLHVMDNLEEQNEIRMKEPYNQNFKPIVLNTILVAMRNLKNWYMKTFHSIGERIRQSLADGKDLGKISVVFNNEYEQSGVHPGRQNAPTSDEELAYVFVDDNDGEPPSFHRSFRVQAIAQPDKRFNRTFLHLWSPHLEPMSYPLLYLDGELQWRPHWTCEPYPGVINEHQEKGFSLLQHTAALMQIRDNVFRPHIVAGRLFQQWLIDLALMVESMRLDWVRLNQDKLKAQSYTCLVNFLNRAKRTLKLVDAVSKYIVVPSTFRASVRNMRQKCLDALAIVRDFGGPDVFITLTANPNWKEIQENLLPGQKVGDRPDLMNRVFKGKFDRMMEMLLKEDLLGKVVAYVYTVEFQKRGKPHIHLLLSMAAKDKFRTKERVDKYFSSELPDKDVNKELFALITSMLVHGPCRPKLCKEKIGDPCKKKFPKQYQEETTFDQAGNCQQRRRAHPKVQGAQGRWIDNSWIVACIPLMIKFLTAHINAEVVGNSMKCIKYLFKYIFKVNLLFHNNHYRFLIIFSFQGI